MSGWSQYYFSGVGVDLYLRHLYGQREFLAAIAKDCPQKILEVGAGTGVMSIFLSQLGIAVSTLDNDPQILEQTEVVKKKFGGCNQILLGDAFKLPFPDQSFDAVFHQGLLEHFADAQIQQILNEQLRVAPVVWLSVPNQNYPRHDFGNERLMSKSQWENILRDYQVKVSRNYSSKFFPRWYLPRVSIQYMAKIIRR